MTPTRDGAGEPGASYDSKIISPTKPFDCNATASSFDCQPPNVPKSAGKSGGKSAGKTTSPICAGKTTSPIPPLLLQVKRMSSKGEMGAPFKSNVKDSLQVERRQPSFGSVACRICHEDDDKEDLIAPCYCAGTMGLIHRSCMQKWLTTSNSTSCELCKCQIQLRSRKRSFCEWLRWTMEEWAVERDRHREIPGDSDGRHLLGDGICFLFLTPMALTSAGLCANSAMNKQDLPWEAAGLVILSVFLVTIYFIWISMSLRFHLSQFSTWQRANLEYFIAATPYPPQGGRVKSRLSEKTVVIRRDGSVQNEDDIRLINPLPSFNATPHRSSFDGMPSTRSHPLSDPISLNDSVFVDVEALKPNDASTPVGVAAVNEDSDADAASTTPKRFVVDFISVDGDDVDSGTDHDTSTLVNTCVVNPSPYRSFTPHPVRAATMQHSDRASTLQHSDSYRAATRQQPDLTVTSQKPDLTGTLQHYQSKSNAVIRPEVFLDLLEEQMSCPTSYEDNDGIDNSTRFPPPPFSVARFLRQASPSSTTRQRGDGLSTDGNNNKKTNNTASNSRRRRSLDFEKTLTTEDIRDVHESVRSAAIAQQRASLVAAAQGQEPIGKACDEEYIAIDGSFLQYGLRISVERKRKMSYLAAVGHPTVSTASPSPAVSLPTSAGASSSSAPHPSSSVHPLTSSAHPLSSAPLSSAAFPADSLPSSSAHHRLPPPPPPMLHSFPSQYHHHKLVPPPPNVSVSKANSSVSREANASVSRQAVIDDILRKANPRDSLMQEIRESPLRLMRKSDGNSVFERDRNVGQNVGRVVYSRSKKNGQIASYM